MQARVHLGDERALYSDERWMNCDCWLALEKPPRWRFRHEWPAHGPDQECRSAAGRSIFRVEESADVELA
jgi:hypothetical protein